MAPVYFEHPNADRRYRSFNELVQGRVSPGFTNKSSSCCHLICTGTVAALTPLAVCGFLGPDRNSVEIHASVAAGARESTDLRSNVACAYARIITHDNQEPTTCLRAAETLDISVDSLSIDRPSIAKAGTHCITLNMATTADSVKLF